MAAKLIYGGEMAAKLIYVGEIAAKLIYILRRSWSMAAKSIYGGCKETQAFWHT